MAARDIGEADVDVGEGGKVNCVKKGGPIIKRQYSTHFIVGKLYN